MKTFLTWVVALAFFALIIYGLALIPEPDEDDGDSRLNVNPEDN